MSTVSGIMFRSELSIPLFQLSSGISNSTWTLDLDVWVLMCLTKGVKDIRDCPTTPLNCTMGSLSWGLRRIATARTGVMWLLAVVSCWSREGWSRDFVVSRDTGFGLLLSSSGCLFSTRAVSRCSHVQGGLEECVGARCAHDSNRVNAGSTFDLVLRLLRII